MLKIVLGLLLSVHAHPDVGLNTMQMIQRQGYPVERHPDIETPDGYLLEMHRIPYSKSNPNSRPKPLVFLMHGLVSSSLDWVNMGPQKSLAYVLSDAGYDVWMGNARGNTYSRRHKYINPDFDTAFWDFSWHEIGIIDVPTMIDYILLVTGQGKLFYIGHSQGTTTVFVMLSEKPEYNQKIRLAIALAPAVFMEHIKQPFISTFAGLHPVVESLATIFGIGELFQNGGIMQLFEQAACSELSPFKSVCASMLFLMGGWNSKKLNESMIPVITPSGCAVKQFMHYAQEVVSGRFCQYDYGPSMNMVRYGSITPPDYRLENVVAPMVFAYSVNDWLSAVEDVDRLAQETPGLVEKFLVPDPLFNHLDYLFAIDVKEILYDHILDLLLLY